MMDYELENLVVDDLDRALDYIGYRARSRNLYQGNKKRKSKSDPVEIPLFAQKILENI